MTRTRSRLVATIVAVVTLAMVPLGCSTATDDDTRAGTQGLPNTAESLAANVWILDGEASSPAITSGELITVNFEKDLVSGHGGCNAFRGEFTLDDHDIKIIDMTATEMACADAGDTSAEAAFLKSLQSASSVDTTDRDRLVIKTTEGELVFKAGERAGS